MLNRTNLIYNYDGSFQGLLCCVFESYYSREIPQDIVPINLSQITFFPFKEIVTDVSKYERVLKSIICKIGDIALTHIQYAFLSCAQNKELNILLFLRIGYKYGPSVMNMLSLDAVNSIFKAVKNITNESHLFAGFIRFSTVDNGLIAEIEPKNCVLPLLKQHFCERFPKEHFLIHDKTNNMALIYEPFKASIIPIEDMKLPALSEDELKFRKLWKLYYDTVEIQGRHNPKCRQTHMPKRYWRYLTEFNCTL